MGLTHSFNTPKVHGGPASFNFLISLQLFFYSVYVIKILSNLEFFKHISIMFSYMLNKLALLVSAILPSILAFVILLRLLKDQLLVNEVSLGESLLISFDVLTNGREKQDFS